MTNSCLIIYVIIKQMFDKNIILSYFVKKCIFLQNYVTNL